MIPRQPYTSAKLITIAQAVQKMNRDRPTIHTLQKAGRIAEKRKALVTPQEDEDNEAFAAELEAQLQVEATTGYIEISSESIVNDNNFQSLGLSRPSTSTPSLELEPRYRRTKEDRKGTQNPHKRKARSQPEEIQENDGPVLRSGRVSKKTKKVRNVKTTV